MPILRDVVLRIMRAITAIKSAMFWFLTLILLIPLLIVIVSTLNQGIKQQAEAMPKFSQESFSKLSTCEHDLQVLFYEVIKTFDCTILVGHRNEADQEIVFKTGNSKKQWPNSKHNKTPSRAVDVTPYPVDWKNDKKFYWFAGYVMGIAQKLKDEGKMTHSIRYGGDWNGNKDITDQTFLDLTHFELVD
jgi:peptidoglycan LD-endopeptidase CwlK